MKTATKPSAFNAAQLDVIKTLSFAKSKRVALELRKVIVTHFSSLIEEEMDKLWESGEMNQKRNDSFTKTHLRTPYKK